MYLSWSKVFKDFRETKLVVLEWEKERRGKYESEETWNILINKMYDIEMSNHDDLFKIKLLMSEIGQVILCDTSVYPKRWMIDEARKTKNKKRNTK